MSIRTRSSLSLLLLSLAVAVPSAAHAFTLTFKFGEAKLLDTTQEISNNDQEFNRYANNIIGVEGETRYSGNNQVAFGVDGFHYRHNFERVATSERERMETFTVLAKGKYFFLPDSPVQPYVGGGVGPSMALDYDGPIESTAAGLAVQGVVGVQYRWENIGMRLEYNYLHARLRDGKSEPDTIDTSSHGYFLGFSIFFGKDRQ
jgi:opacity protein-like surface antigen